MWYENEGWRKSLSAKNFSTTKRAFLSPRPAKPAGSQHPWCRGSAGMWHQRWAWDFYVSFWFSAQVRTMVWCSPGNNPSASFPAAPRAPSPHLWQAWFFHPVWARLQGCSCRAAVIQQSRAGADYSWIPCWESGIRKVHKERERRVGRAPTISIVNPNLALTNWGLLIQLINTAPRFINPGLYLLLLRSTGYFSFINLYKGEFKWAEELKLLRNMAG